MQLLLSGIGLILAAGLPGLFSSREGNGGERLACVMTLAGSGMVLLATLFLLQGEAVATFSLKWSVPGGTLALVLDPLAACFVLPLLVVVATGAVYGLKYWPQRTNPTNGRKFRLFYGLISGAMILLLLARNGMLFLMAWEVMALSGFFLITTVDHEEDVRRAGFIYLIATHTGTLALFAMFALLGQATGSLDYPAAGTLPAAGSTLIFLLGLLGFGMKAGLMPLHIWLPGAHAAAPSHASALLSGVMIKTGIYGLIRLTSLFAEIPPWWGWTILVLGAVSGVMGVALALAQHDIKRLLAYHSVENIGIIAMGLGLALLGRSYGLPSLVFLGLSGCLLHVANHGFFKSLLFLSAGSVIHAVGSRKIDRYGGLLRRQPWTGAMFLGGAVAISGLPPLNGFVSEWLIYLGAFQPLRQPSSAVAIAVLSAPVLALIGGLALACFVKVFGIAFLGEPRSTEAALAHEASPLMVAPMVILFACCAGIGLLPFTLQSLLQEAAASWSNLPYEQSTVLASLSWISLSGWLLLTLLAMTFLLIRLRSREAPRDVDTWGCGYQFPAPRMQYTASSFADFLVQLFRFGLRSEKHGNRVTGLFPDKIGFSCHTPDVVLDRLLIPVFGGVGWLFRQLRAWFHNGSMALYLLYVILTVVALWATLPR
jgi:hydrogenase-4 component B